MHPFTIQMIAGEEAETERLSKETQSMQQKVSEKQEDIIRIEGSIAAKHKKLEEGLKVHESERLKQCKKVDRMKKRVEDIRGELQSNNDVLDRLKEEQQGQHSELKRVDAERVQIQQNIENERVRKLKHRDECKLQCQQLRCPDIHFLIV